MKVIKGISLNNVQKAKDILIEDAEIMKTLRDRLKEEGVPLKEQNDIRKKVIDILSKDLLITMNLSSFADIINVW
jgi:hypothetical protein